jgi:hypothetical protein
MKYMLMLFTILVIISSKNTFLSIFQTKEEYVIDFIARNKELFEETKLSTYTFKIFYTVGVLLLIIFCIMLSIYINQMAFTILSMFLIASMAYGSFKDFKIIENQSWNKISKNLLGTIIWCGYVIYSLAMQIKMF